MVNKPNCPWTNLGQLKCRGEILMPQVIPTLVLGLESKRGTLSLWISKKSPVSFGAACARLAE